MTPQRQSQRSRQRPSRPPGSDSNGVDPSPPETTTDPEEDSEVFSTGSSAAEFIADPGPGFDAEQAPAPPEPEEPPSPLEEWDEQRIREFLVIQGEVTHAVLKVGKDDDETWIHTERDLGSIAPPLTRILNRYDITRAAAAAGDEILLATAVSRYAARNYTRRRRLLAAAKDAGPQPITGVPAEPGTGPEDDEQWQRTVGPPALVPKGAKR